MAAPSRKPWLSPAPTYQTFESFWDSDEDAPGPRCAHTLTAIAPTKSHGPRLILFGGTTAIEGGGGFGISMCYYFFVYLFSLPDVHCMFDC